MLRHVANSQRLWVAVALAAAVTGVVSARPAGQAAGTQAPPPPAVGTGLIIGQVVDVDTGRGLPNVPVALMSTGPAAAQGRAGGPSRPPAVITDSQGRFYFGALPAGSYGLITEVQGYTNAGPVQPLVLGEGATITDARLPLRKLSRLAGRVLDDAGHPVVGMEVLVFQRLSSQGRPPALSPAGRGRTNDRGEYQVGPLQANEYLVCACSRDPIPFDGHLLTILAGRPVDLLGVARRAAEAGADTAELDASLRTFPVTFHPAATMVSQAERVRLAPAEHRTGVDITVTAVPARRVSGRLLGAATTVQASMLRLRPMNDVPEAAGLTQIVPMLVQPDGRFDFGNVPPGQYVLEVTFRPGLRGGGPSGAALGFIGGRGAAMTPPPPPPQPAGAPADPALDPLWAQEVISVGEADVLGLTVPLNRSLVVSGRVVFSGTAPPPNPQTLQRPIIQMLSLEMGPQVRTYNSGVRADGSFELRGVLPGRYALNSLALPGWPTLQSITSPNGDLTDMLLDLTTDLNGVVITWTDAPATSVEVRVQPEPRDDTDAIWLRIFPADRRYWSEPFGATRRFRMLRANAKGLASLTGLPAGDYLVAAATDGSSDWMTAEGIELASRQAARVRLTPGDKQIVEVRR